MLKDEHGEPMKESDEKLATVAHIQSASPENTRTGEFSDPVATDVREVWDTVRVGIEEILSQNPQLTYRPEDVYSELVADRAVLFMSPLGWGVLTIDVDKFTNDRSLLIWLAYTYKTGGHNWMDHESWLMNIAAGENCKFIEARSAVPQMEQYATQRGWVIDTRIYRKEVVTDG